MTSDNLQPQELSDRLKLIEEMMVEGRRSTTCWAWSFVLWGVAYYAAIAWASLAHVAALACLPWSIWPFVIVFLVQAWVAFERDGRDLVRFWPRAILARFAFAVAVPWIVTVNQLRGRLSKQQLSNRQNIGD